MKKEEVCYNYLCKLWKEANDNEKGAILIIKEMMNAQNRRKVNSK